MNRFAGLVSAVLGECEAVGQIYRVMSVVMIHELFAVVGICICNSLQSCAGVNSKTEITSCGLHTCHVFGRKPYL
jgi:hypothetical protein